MLATIRNRRGLIAAVEPFDSQEGRLHLVRVEYTDSDGVAEDTVLWEREHGRDLLEPNALPQVQSEASMEPREFDALVRAARWAALTPFCILTGRAGHQKHPSPHHSLARRRWMIFSSFRC
jgi:hypothetical protein